MKLTKTKLKEIIKEEIAKLLAESNIDDRSVRVPSGRNYAGELPYKVGDEVINTEDPDLRTVTVVSIGPQGVVVLYPYGEETLDPNVVITLDDAESRYGSSVVENY